MCTRTAKSALFKTLIIATKITFQPIQWKTFFSKQTICTFVVVGRTDLYIA